MAIVQNQSTLVEAVQNRVDDTPANASVTDWLNAGQNIMAAKVGAVFPQLDPNNSSSQLVFDDKWAEIPVLYACARFKQSDLMYSDADRYMQQFNDLLRDFAVKYQVPPQYKDEPNMTQFIATAGQADFIITDETFDPAYGILTVYKNNRKLTPDVDFTLDNTTFSLVSVCIGGEFITARWEMSTDTQQPPYTWWTNW